MKKIFATLFTDMWNIQLIKDPGMIPFTFDKEYGYKSIIPIFDGREYPFKDLYFHDIDMPVLHGNRTQFIRDIARTKWLIKNAKRIDLLNLFFFYRGTWFLMWLYKKLNPKGLIYIHTDSDGKRLLEFEYSKNPIKRFIIKNIFLNDRVIEDTYWGVQNSINAKKLKGKWPFFNLEFIPNGVSWESGKEYAYENKQNIILTVARIGSRQKNTDKLMEVFSKLSDDFPEWKLRLVGPIEESFKTYIDIFFKKNPDMKKRIEFIGPIFDRNKLEEEYANAKIFCLPSSWEGFSLSGVEALSKGCYILGSRIPSNIELTQNEMMGLLFENENWGDFENVMRLCLSNEKKIEDTFQLAVKYANNHYSWKKALEPVEIWAEEKWRTME